MKLKQLFIPLSGLALISLASPSHASDGQQYTRTFTVDAGATLPDPRPVFVEVPTMGRVELLGCSNSQPSGYPMNTVLVSFEDAQPFSGVGTVSGGNSPGAVSVTDQIGGLFEQGGGWFLSVHGSGDPSATVGHWEWSLWREDGDNVAGAHVSIDGWNDTTSGQCHFRATVLQNG